jgi:hypothetical protein
MRLLDHRVSSQLVRWHRRRVRVHRVVRVDAGLGALQSLRPRLDARLQEVEIDKFFFLLRTATGQLSRSRKMVKAVSLIKMCIHDFC